MSWIAASCETLLNRQLVVLRHGRRQSFKQLEYTVYLVVDVVWKVEPLE